MLLDPKLWPLPVQTQKAQVFIDLSALKPLQKRNAWNYLRENSPELAALLKDMSEDPLVDEIKKKFGASICIPGDSVPQLLLKEGVTENA